MYNYVVTASKPSAVFQSLRGNFTGKDDNNLILGKSTRIEIWKDTENVFYSLI
jgi:DNA damage-binding protein 1